MIPPRLRFLLDAGISDIFLFLFIHILDFMSSQRHPYLGLDNGVWCVISKDRKMGEALMDEILDGYYGGLARRRVHLARA